MMWKPSMRTNCAFCTDVFELPVKTVSTLIMTRFSLLHQDVARPWTSERRAHVEKRWAGALNAQYKMLLFHATAIVRDSDDID